MPTPDRAQMEAENSTELNWTEAQTGQQIVAQVNSLPARAWATFDKAAAARRLSAACKTRGQKNMYIICKQRGTHTHTLAHTHRHTHTTRNRHKHMFKAARTSLNLCSRIWARREGACGRWALGGQKANGNLLYIYVDILPSWKWIQSVWKPAAVPPGIDYEATEKPSLSHTPIGAGYLLMKLAKLLPITTVNRLTNSTAATAAATLKILILIIAVAANNMYTSSIWGNPASCQIVWW